MRESSSAERSSEPSSPESSGSNWLDGAARVYGQDPIKTAGSIVVMGLIFVVMVFGLSQQRGVIGFFAALLGFVGLAFTVINAFDKITVGSDEVIVRKNFESRCFERGHATAAVYEMRHAHRFPPRRTRHLLLTTTGGGQTCMFDLSGMSKPKQRAMAADVEAALGQRVQGRGLLD